MSRYGRDVAVAIVVAAAILASGTGTGMDGAGDESGRAQAQGAQGLYAANFNGASVTEYALDAAGNAAPLRTIRGPRTGLGNVRDVAVDAAGDIYAVNLSGPVFVAVFAPRADGDAAPIRQLGGLGMVTRLSDPLAIALDARGYLYVANQTEGVETASILVFAPGANGNVAPVRQITGAGEAVKLAIDRAGDLVVAVTGGLGRPLPNRVLVYAPGPTAPQPPSAPSSVPIPDWARQPAPTRSPSRCCPAGCACAPRRRAARRRASTCTPTGPMAMSRRGGASSGPRRGSAKRTRWRSTGRRGPTWPAPRPTRSGCTPRTRRATPRRCGRSPVPIPA